MYGLLEKSRVMREIKVNPLSQSSIQSAIQELEDYKKLLMEFPVTYTRALCEYFANTLSMEAPNMTQFWILDLQESEGKATGIFKFDKKPVQFVEFGSGYIGSTHHDGINEEWLSKLPPPYNIGYNEGTGYIRNKDDPPNSYWVYHDANGFHSTQGRPADPFIYRSVQELLDARAGIAKSLLGLGV